VPSTRVIAYPLPWRIAAAALTSISRGSLPVLAVLVLWLGAELRLDNPLRLLRVFSGLVVVPAVLGWLLARAFEGRVTVADGLLVLERQTQRIEIPCASIGRIVPWSIPLPAGGLWLMLRSGRRFPLALQLADPVALVEALVAAGAPAQLAEAAREPAAVYARSLPAPPSWYGALLRYALFALVPTLPLFRLHQWIAYGGTFGEYYMYGLPAYALGFLLFWSTSAISLVLWRAVLRTLAEPLVLACAHLAPQRTPRVRGLVERLVTVLYYAAVPAYLAWLWSVS